MENSMSGVGRMRALAACCIVFTSRTFQHLRVVRATRAQASPLQNFPHIFDHNTMELITRIAGRPQLFRSSLRLGSQSRRRHLTNNGFFRVSEEVREALHSKKPVIALETTIYTHGTDLYI